MMGSIEASSLTEIRFPSLRYVVLNADDVDLSVFPAHGNLRTLIVPPIARNPEVFANLYNWPRLRRVEHFREDIVLSPCVTDEMLVPSHDDSRPSTIAERYVDSNIEKLLELFEAREAKLRAERLRKEKLREEHLRLTEAPCGLDTEIDEIKEGLDGSA